MRRITRWAVVETVLSTSSDAVFAVLGDLGVRQAVGLERAEALDDGRGLHAGGDRIFKTFSAS